MSFRGDPSGLVLSNRSSPEKATISLTIFAKEKIVALLILGHSLRVGAAQDLLIKGYDLAAIMRAGGWFNA